MPPPDTNADPQDRPPIRRPALFYGSAVVAFGLLGAAVIALGLLS